MSLLIAVPVLISVGLYLLLEKHPRLAEPTAWLGCAAALLWPYRSWVGALLQDTPLPAPRPTPQGIILILAAGIVAGPVAARLWLSKRRLAALTLTALLLIPVATLAIQMSSGRLSRERSLGVALAGSLCFPFAWWHTMAGATTEMHRDRSLGADVWPAIAAMGVWGALSVWCVSVSMAGMAATAAFPILAALRSHDAKPSNRHLVAAGIAIIIGWAGLFWTSHSGIPYVYRDPGGPPPTGYDYTTAAYAGFPFQGVELPYSANAQEYLSIHKGYFWFMADFALLWLGAYLGMKHFHIHPNKALTVAITAAALAMAIVGIGHLAYLLD